MNTANNAALTATNSLSTPGTDAATNEYNLVNGGTIQYSNATAVSLLNTAITDVGKAHTDYATATTDANQAAAALAGQVSLLHAVSADLAATAGNLVSNPATTISDLARLPAMLDAGALTAALDPGALLALMPQPRSVRWRGAGERAGPD